MEHSCNTCYYYITDYDEHDKAHWYCHLTMEPLLEYKKDCKSYKPSNKERYIKHQRERILANLQIILDITSNHLENKDLELIYTCANDSMCRMEEIQNYKGE